MYEKKVILTRFLHHFLQKMHIRQKYQTTGTTQQQLKTIVVLALSHAKGANGANGLSRKIKWMGQFLNFFFGFHGMLGTNGTKMEIFYLISQSCTWRCRKACLRRNYWAARVFSDYYGQKEMFSLDAGY